MVFYTWFFISTLKLVKLLIIFYASDYILPKLSLNNKIRESFLPITLVLSIISILLQQPDFGVCGHYINCIADFFLGGLNFKQILLVRFSYINLLFIN